MMMIYLYTSSLIPMLLFRNALSFLSIQLNKLNMLDPPTQGAESTSSCNTQSESRRKKKICMHVYASTSTSTSQYTNKKISINKSYCHLHHMSSSCRNSHSTPNHFPTEDHTNRRMAKEHPIQSPNPSQPAKPQKKRRYRYIITIMRRPRPTTQATNQPSKRSTNPILPTCHASDAKQKKLAIVLARDRSNKRKAMQESKEARKSPYKNQNLCTKTPQKTNPRTRRQTSMIYFPRPKTIAPNEEAKRSEAPPSQKTRNEPNNTEEKVRYIGCCIIW